MLNIVFILACMFVFGMHAYLVTFFAAFASKW